MEIIRVKIEKEFEYSFQSTIRLIDWTGQHSKDFSSIHNTDIWDVGLYECHRRMPPGSSQELYFIVAAYVFNNSNVMDRALSCKLDQNEIAYGRFLIFESRGGVESRDSTCRRLIQCCFLISEHCLTILRDRIRIIGKN